MLSLILTLAVTGSPAVLPDGTYNYVSVMNGSPVGKTQIAVKRQPSGDIVLTENGSGSMNGQSGSVQDTLTLDASFAPSAYTSLASLADSRSMRSSLSLKNDKATQSGDVSKEYTLTGGAKHFVVMDVGPLTGFFVLPAQMQAWNDSAVLAIAPTYAQTFPLAIATVSASPPAGIPPADKQLAFGTDLRIAIWYDPKTFVVDEVDVPAQGITVKRAP